jgi:catechol 2,3-dioxygenase-like lactoylglutathione lyase family enzyme
MIDTIPARIKVTELNQVGLIVRDIEKTVKDYWNILGIGPHIIVTVEPVEGYSMNYRGKPAKFKFKASFCRVGPLELELIQSVEGPNIYEEHLRKQGEGANHLQSLAKSVAEVEKQVETFDGNGFPLLMEGHFGSEVGFAYIDTFRALKTIWETVKMPDNPSGVPVIYPSDPSEPSPAKIKVKAISRIGIVVKNLEEVMNGYRNISDIGPFDTLELKYPGLHDVTYRGRVVNPEWKIASANAGSVQLELIQPVSGENIFNDFMSKHGEGIHHIQFLVDDIEETNRIMETEGFPVLMGGRILDGGFAYYDTSGPLKVIWEAFQKPKTEFPK